MSPPFGKRSRAAFDGGVARPQQPGCLWPRARFSCEPDSVALLRAAVSSPWRVLQVERLTSTTSLDSTSQATRSGFGCRDPR